MDALVGVKIFLVLLNRKLGLPLEEQYEPIRDEDSWARVTSLCQGLVDARFQRSESRCRPTRAKVSTQELEVSKQPAFSPNSIAGCPYHPLVWKCDKCTQNNKILDTVFILIEA